MGDENGKGRQRGEGGGGGAGGGCCYAKGLFLRGGGGNAREVLRRGVDGWRARQLET